MKVADIEVTHLGSYGDDNTVANAARVSFHKESSNYTDEQNEKLINYLAKHKHFSPFNHAFLSFRVKAPIFVARQLVKHKFLPWNEVSRRYVDEEPEVYLPQPRMKADNVKQGSSNILVEGWDEDFLKYSEEAIKLYNQMINAQVAPEIARAILPQNIMTEWVWSGTLGAFLEMLVLRLDKHTQAETRIVAEKIATTVSELFPISYKARIND